MMFASLNEFEYFMNCYCFSCARHDLFYDEQPCPIETAIGDAMTDESKFPKKYIHRKKANGVWTCQKFKDRERWYKS